MKTISLRIVFFAAMAVALSACLKDSLYDDGTLQSLKRTGDDKLIEIHLTSSDNTNIIKYALDNTVKDTVITTFVPVQLTSLSSATEDIKIKFDLLSVKDTVDNMVYDSLVNKSKFMIPTAHFSIVNENNTVVIPKGQHVGYIQMKFSPSAFIGFNSVLGFKLNSVEGGGCSLSNLIYGYAVFTAKSVYDAKYICNGYRIRPGNPTEPVSNEIRRLSTINANTVQDPKFGNFDGYQVNVEVTDQTIMVGGVKCYKVIATPVDENGKVSGGMFDTFTGDANAKPAPPVNPTEINYYNPKTKTFVLNCYYTAAVNRIMYEVLVRQ